MFLMEIQTEKISRDVWILDAKHGINKTKLPNRHLTILSQIVPETWKQKNIDVLKKVDKAALPILFVFDTAAVFGTNAHFCACPFSVHITTLHAIEF